MRVAIRADATLATGTGHVMRCLTLAGMLRQDGAEVLFIARTLEGRLADLIRERGCALLLMERGADGARDFGGANRVPPGADWQWDAGQTREAIKSWGAPADLLVLDHYGLDRRWERLLRPHVRRLLVIDDLANRPHECDLLLDPNLHDHPADRYKGLVAADTRVFVGPQYALLRPEFEAAVPRERASGLQRLLVFFGGTDSTNEAGKVVTALRTLGADAPAATVILGPANPNGAAVRHAAHGLASLDVLDSTDAMATLIASADLAAGTCGGSAWERCVLGLPALVVVTADNQRDDARILHDLGAVRNLGEADLTGSEQWVDEIRALLHDPARLLDMSRAAAGVMRGRADAARELEAALVA